MKIITSLDDGHIKRFLEYEAHGGVGFQGYERMLYLSLVAALKCIAERECQIKALQQVYEGRVPDAADDESTG
jgi:hypothetical protein